MARRELLALARASHQLPQLVAESAACEPMGIPQVAKAIADKSGEQAAEVARLLSSMLQLHDMRTDLEVTPEELFDVISAALESDLAEGEVEPSDLNAWNSARDSIVDCVSGLGPDHPLRLSQQIDSLGTAYGNVFTSSQLITNLRPMFNATSNAPVRLLVTYSLIINFFDGRTSRRMEFAVDTADVAQLRRDCARAEAETAALPTNLPLPVVTFPRTTN